MTNKDKLACGCAALTSGSCAVIAVTSMLAPISMPALVGFFGSIYVFKKLFN